MSAGRMTTEKETRTRAVAAASKLRAVEERPTGVARERAVGTGVVGGLLPPDYEATVSPIAFGNQTISMRVA